MKDEVPVKKMAKILHKSTLEQCCVLYSWETLVWCNTHISWVFPFGGQGRWQVVITYYRSVDRWQFHWLELTSASQDVLNSFKQIFFFFSPPMCHYEGFGFGFFFFSFILNSDQKSILQNSTRIHLRLQRGRSTWAHGIRWCFFLVVCCFGSSGGVKHIASHQRGS